MIEIPPLHPKIAEVLKRIEDRSHESRAAYLSLIRRHKPKGYARKRLTEGNQAHASAGCVVMDKLALLDGEWPNIGIITAYNDMLSAHSPFETYPQLIRDAARAANATAQVAGGVPAMCDGVTQGQPGMELSLFSRDVIAMASAIGLSHNTFDAGLHLGVCDKIIPGLVIAALRFGWLPHIFVPAGPMPSGLPNPEKARIRQEFAQGKIGRDVLLKAESDSYHSPGTCTFYGTANSNQMMMEVMGLHLPGTAFVPPGTPLREALTRAATKHIISLTIGQNYTPMGEMIDARSMVNAIIGLMATGGSTNHALHIPAMAAAAGIKVTLEDFADISSVIPLLCRIYPNGSADVNHFHAAGGIGFIMRELIQAGLFIADARGLMGPLTEHVNEPFLEGEELVWRMPPSETGNSDILRPFSDPFSPNGGLCMIKGPLGRGISKVSAVKDEHRKIHGPARVFNSQHDLKDAFEAGQLNGDFIAIIRFQGPSANGMPELHSLSPVLGSLQDAGYKVALVTDGRMSGASGKVPSAIHISPEAAKGGPLAKIEDGDLITLDTHAGTLELHVNPAEFDARPLTQFRPNDGNSGLGREMFESFRNGTSHSETGGMLFAFDTHS